MIAARRPVLAVSWLSICAVLSAGLIAVLAEFRCMNGPVLDDDIASSQVAGKGKFRRYAYSIQTRIAAWVPKTSIENIIARTDNQGLSFPFSCHVIVLPVRRACACFLNPQVMVLSRACLRGDSPHPQDDCLKGRIKFLFSRAQLTGSPCYASLIFCCSSRGRFRSATIPVQHRRHSKEA